MRISGNIRLVQVDSVGRALALAEGVVDVVFWTRGLTEGVGDLEALSEAEREVLKDRLEAQLTDEEKAILTPENRPADETRQQYSKRDMPSGAIITQPYFADFPAWVILK